MLLPYQILVPLLGLFLCRVDLTDLFPLKLEVKILKVLDGDTLLVGHRSLEFKLRLSKLDAPEKKQLFIKGGEAGEASRRCLFKLLNLKRAHILRMERYDIYGRVLGDLEDLNFKAISHGCSGLYPHTQFSSRKERSLYLRSLARAKRMRAGVWASGGYRRPKLWRKSRKQNANLR